MNTHAHHRHTPADYGRAFGIGIAINSAFVAAEAMYGLKAGSLALLADAGHNAGDILGLCMAWGASRLAKQRATARFTYGLQSASIIAALANALLLLIAVAGIGWQSVLRFSEPTLPQTGVVMAVAMIGALVGGATAWLFRRGHRHDLNIRGVYLHMAADAAISLGVVVSGGLMMATGWAWIDPAVSLAIVMVIVAGTWRMLEESLRLALHAVPEGIDAAEVKAYLAALEGVREVHDLHIWAMSTTDIAMSVHLLIPGGHPGDRFIHEATHGLEEHFRIGHATIQIEIGDEAAACRLAAQHGL